LRNLKVLDLSHNHIHTISEKILNLHNLEKINLRFNDIKEIPPCLEQLPLRFIDLNSNPLCSFFRKYIIPPKLENMPANHESDENNDLPHEYDENDDLGTNPGDVFEDPRRNRRNNPQFARLNQGHIRAVRKNNFQDTSSETQNQHFIIQLQANLRKIKDHYLVYIYEKIKENRPLEEFDLANPYQLIFADLIEIECCKYMNDTSRQILNNIEHQRTLHTKEFTILK
jgi:Leucine-rich repeat (LRR) protein